MAAYREKEEIEFGQKRAVNGPTPGVSEYMEEIVSSLSLPSKEE